MPKESKQQNLFFKKSLTRHLGAGGHHSTSDHSDKSTPTASEDEAGTRTSRVSEQRGTEERETEQQREAVSVGPAPTEPAVTEERAAKTRTERFQPPVTSNDEAESSSVSTSSDGRDSRMTDSKTSKRPIRAKKEHVGRGSYPQRGSYRGKPDRRDSGRMGYYPRGPRPMIPFPHHHGRPPPPPHILEQLSQSPRDSAFMGPISSPRRTPRHSESSSCGSPLHYSGQTPPQSPRHFYESPVHSPLRHHISPYNSPPRHSVSPIPRMLPPDMIHPAMMPPQQHPMPSIPVPLPQPEMGHFSGTPPQHFHPMNNPHMRPMTPEQHHILASMHHQQQQQQQQRVAEQQLEHHHQQQQMVQQLKLKHTQESVAHVMMQMKQMALQGQNITMTPEQLNQLQHWHFISQQQNMMPGPGGQGMLPGSWMQQGGPQPDMMMNPIPQPNPEMPQRLQSGPMGQQMHPMFMQQQQQHHHQLPNFMGQHNIPFNMNQLMEHSQPIMVPQPIHPEMGNTARITPPQNVNMPLNHSNFDPPRMQAQHFVPSPQLAMCQVPSPHIAVTSPQLAMCQVTSPSLPLDIPETVTPPTEAAPVSVEPVKPQDAVYTSNIPATLPPTTAATSQEVPVKSTPIETSAKTPSSTPETQSKTAKTKTPGLIRLPPQLPTEEELLKSPDSGTPVSMKKNYWQKRQKSTESAEKKGQIELPHLEESAERELLETSTKVPDAEKAKESVSKSAEAKSDPPSSDVTPAPAVTPKKSSGKVVKSKAFNLSDLGDLVTSTVKHNSNIPKTDISSGSVEIVLNQGIRRTQSPCLARASERTDSRDGDNWRPLSREAKAKVEGTSSWRAQDNPASSSAGIFAEDPDRKEALREAETRDLSTGQQIQYAIGKLQSKSSGQRTASESSSNMGAKEDLVELGEEAWYDEEDEDQIDCFDLTI